MKNTIMVGVEFEGFPGTQVSETVNEVFWWFYTGDGQGARTATIRHLNGVKVTFEREG